MTLKGFRDGAFLAGLALIWIDLVASQPPDLWTVLLITAPTVMRAVEATRKSKGDRHVGA